MIQTPSGRADEEAQKTPKLSPDKPIKGDDSYDNPTDFVSNSGGAAAANPSNSRISHNRLEDIARDLTVRDLEILSALRHCRYLLTKQVQRLFFTDSVSPTSGLRITNRVLHKLQGLGVADTLSRRIGGVRSGSGSFVWFLTPTGERLLRLGDDGPHVRKRFMEPSMHFLTHTLSVAECYVQLTEICDGDTLKLIRTEMETDCWRSYSYKGIQTSLRPDLYAITNCEEYEDRWFFEIDLKTESPIVVIEKCRRYHEYYQSGLEQQLHGVFPLTVWIVPDAARRDSLVANIRAEFAGLPKLFVVILPSELESLIRQGVGGGTLC